MVPLARLERARPKTLDFESSASTNSATGAHKKDGKALMVFSGMGLITA